MILNEEVIYDDLFEDDCFFVSLVLVVAKQGHNKHTHKHSVLESECVKALQRYLPEYQNGPPEYFTNCLNNYPELLAKLAKSSNKMKEHIVYLGRMILAGPEHPQLITRFVKDRAPFDLEEIEMPLVCQQLSDRLHARCQVQHETRGTLNFDPESGAEFVLSIGRVRGNWLEARLESAPIEEVTRQEEKPGDNGKPLRIHHNLWSLLNFLYQGASSYSASQAEIKYCAQKFGLKRNLLGCGHQPDMYKPVCGQKHCKRCLQQQTQLEVQPKCPCGKQISLKDRALVNNKTLHYTTRNS